MKESLLTLLRCPVDKSELTLVDPVYRDNEIESGFLCCAAAGHRYAIINFIPVMLNEDPFFQETSSVDQWGFQWHNRDWMKSKYYGKEWLDREFGEWNIPEDWFAGKNILEAGCGNGRNTLILQRFKYRECVVFDLSNSVYTMLHQKEFANVHLVRADMARPPFADGYFDLVLARQVLQHTKDPGASIKALTGVLKTGGYFVGSLYLTPERLLTFVKLKLIGIIRSVLSLFPAKLIYYFTWLSVPFYRYRILYPLARLIFLQSPFDTSDEFTWNLNHDQYIASYQYTFTRKQTRAMYAAAGLTDLVESRIWPTLYRSTKKSIS